MTLEETVDDGFGCSANAICPDCGYRSVYVCRPGDIRCSVCEEREYQSRREEQ